MTPDVAVAQLEERETVALVVEDSNSSGHPISGVTCRANRQPSGSRLGRHVWNAAPPDSWRSGETGPPKSFFIPLSHLTLNEQRETDEKVN